VGRAETLTKLPLDRWAAIMGYNPLHFNGLYDPEHPPGVCGQPLLQFSWQASDRVGREEIAIAIAEAESEIEKFLGFRLLPTWETDEWQPTMRPYAPEMVNLSGTDIRGMASVVAADWGYFISGGIRANTLIDADAVITYTDEDGDGYDEIATVTVAVDQGQDPCEVRVYFPVSDGMVTADGGGADQWEIRPINVSVAGLVATIRFRRELAVLPALQLDVVPPPDDSHLRGEETDVDANFLAEVDVYRVYNDPQTQVTFLWEPIAIGCSSCNGSGCPGCAYTAQAGCLMLRSRPRLSMVSIRPATWDDDLLQFALEAYIQPRLPDVARLYYYAGWRDRRLACSTVVMDPALERSVAILAASKLDRTVCSCEAIQAQLDHWRYDFAGPGDSIVPRLPDRMMACPFGTQRGAIEAWQRLQGLVIGKAVTA